MVGVPGRWAYLLPGRRGHRKPEPIGIPLAHRSRERLLPAPQRVAAHAAMPRRQLVCPGGSSGARGHIRQRRRAQHQAEDEGEEVEHRRAVVAALGAGMIGALIFLQKIRISPDTAFSVNDWTAFVIFIAVIGGIGLLLSTVFGGGLLMLRVWDPAPVVSERVRILWRSLYEAFTTSATMPRTTDDRKVEIAGSAGSTSQIRPRGREDSASTFLLPRIRPGIRNEAVSIRHPDLRQRVRVEDVGEYGKIYFIRAPFAPVFDRRYRLILPSQFMPGLGRTLIGILERERPELIEICDKYSLPYLAAMLRKQWHPRVPRPVLAGLTCERFDDNMAAYLSRSRAARPTAGSARRSPGR